MTDVPVTCDYCGLPAPLSAWSWSATSHSNSAAKQYCCFGCRFAAAVTQSGGEEGAANWTLTRLGISIFLSMNVMVFTMALWTQEFYGPGGSAEGFTETLRGLFRYLCLLFSLPVLFLLGGPLLENAWISCRRGVLNADVLLILGVAAAYLYSAISVLRDTGPVYFEVGCMVLVLVTLGRWLEATGKLRASRALEALHRLLPEQARIVDEAGERLVAVATIVAGDYLRVLPGERLPCDGVVERNTGMVDEQALTGESQPALKEPGDCVFGASLNLDGDLYIRASGAAGSSALVRLIDLVRQARFAKGCYERLADRVSAWFLPFVIAVAIGAAAWHGAVEGIDQGILTGLAVLLIACPCALGLATPMAVWNALGQAARTQILFRNGEALERLACVKAMCFDKTGTLTTSNPVVAHFTVADREDAAATLAAASCLASASTHAYAGAVREFARQHGAGGTCDMALSATRTLPGRGIIGNIGAERFYFGSPRFLSEQGLHPDARLVDIMAAAQGSGGSVTCIGRGASVCGVFVLREELRPEVATALAQLRELGLALEVLTGDGAARGVALERQLGLPVHAELLPEGKVTVLGDLRCRHGPVAMVGDGINDAPALATSDVGIALGCGADVTRESATLCLLGNDLGQLPWVIRLARRTVAIVRRNLFWAFVYNIMGIGLACTGRLNPVFAALAMVLSSFLVVSNSLRLRVPGRATDENAVGRIFNPSDDVPQLSGRIENPSYEMTAPVLASRLQEPVP